MGVIIAACAASAGIVFPNLWMLVLVGLTLFFLAVRSSEVTSFRACLYGLFFGVVTAGAGTVWFWWTLPLDFLGILQPGVQRMAVAMTWAYVSFSMAFAVGLVSSILGVSGKIRGGRIIVALLWCLAEYGRMWGFALATWAPESLFGAHFSVASVGYPLTEFAELRRFAFPWGIDGLNFLTAFAAAACGEILLPRGRAVRVQWIAAEVLLVCAIFVFPHATGRSENGGPGFTDLRVAVLANSHMDVRDLSSHAFMREQIAQVARAEPLIDVMIFPEEFSLTSIFWSADEARDFIRAHFAERDVLILHTRNDSFPANETNSEPTTNHQ